MPAIVIQNVPDDLHRRLEEEAARHRQPLDRHALAILERAMRGDAPPPVPIRGKRKITQDWLDSAIDEGRA